VIFELADNYDRPLQKDHGNASNCSLACMKSYDLFENFAYTSRCLFSTNATMLDISGSWKWLIFTDSVPATVDCLEALEIFPIVCLSSTCEDTTDPLI
jgi:hypothetical protein